MNFAIIQCVVENPKYDIECFIRCHFKGSFCSFVRVISQFALTHFNFLLKTRYEFKFVRGSLYILPYNSKRVLTTYGIFE